MNNETKNNEDTSAFICPALAEFIKAKGLYDDGFDKYRSVMLRLLDDKRFYHSECVSESAAELAKLFENRGCEVQVAETIEDGVRTAMDIAEELDGMVCACGSLYICGEIRSCFGLK